MANGFDFYEGTKSENTTPRITVRKGGQLVLTRGAVEMLGEGVSHVQLGFNAKTKVVGIRAAAEDAKGRYQLRRQGNNGLHLITGKRFFSHHGLDAAKARSFDVEQVADGLVGFRLTEEPTEAPAEAPAEIKKQDGRKKARTRRPSAKAAS